MRLSVKEAVLFDMDGVVVDSMPWHVQAWREAFRVFGLDIPEETLYLHEGAIEVETSRKIFEDQGVTPTRELFERVLALQRRIFTEKYRHLVKPFPEIPDLLRDLRLEGRKLALVTSSHRQILEDILPKGLLGLFHFVLTGDQVRRRKPHPEPYLKAAESLGVARDKALAVENAPAGIKAAKGAGLFCVALTTTLSPEHLKEADLVVPDHKNLYRLLTQNGHLS